MIKILKSAPKKTIIFSYTFNMKYIGIKKYLSIVFLLAIFTASFHHHDDVSKHNSCQICTIISSINNADIPTEVIYFTQLSLLHEVITTYVPSFHLSLTNTTFHSRAPPHLS